MALGLERIYKLTVQSDQALNQLKGINRATSGIAAGFAKLQRAVGAAFGAMAAFRGVKGLVEASDQIKLLEGSFEALTGSGTRAADMLQRAFSTVADTGASLQDVSTTFQRLTVGLEELGATNAQVEAVANTFIKLGRVSGTSMFDTNAALVQFSQGLASGKLQGDELRSIMERLPLITKLIQEEWNRVNTTMKVTRGDIKQLGRDGKLSAQLIANALLNGAALTKAQFEKLTFILEQEQNRLAASWRKLQAEFADITGIDDAVKDSVNAFSNSLDRLRNNLKLFKSDIKAVWDFLTTSKAAMYALGGVVTLTLLPAIFALDTALVALALRNPIGIIATATLIAIPLLIANLDKIHAVFMYKLPAAFYATSSAFYEWLNDMVGGDSVLYTLAIIAERNALKMEKAYGNALAEIANDMEDMADSAAGAFENMDDMDWDAVRAGVPEFHRLYVAAMKLQDTADPLRKFSKAISDLRAMKSMNLPIDPAIIDAEIKAITDAYVNGADEIDNRWKELKDTINGFVRDFTDTLVDGLAEGTFAFKDFVENALKTLAKLYLNKIFTQVVDLIPTFGGQSLAPVTTAGITQFGGGGVALSTVGLLQSPEYGFGSPSTVQTGTTVNVFNNAGVEVEATEKRTSRGLEIDILIERQINKSIVGGGLDKSMSSAFGIRRMAF